MSAQEKMKHWAENFNVSTFDVGPGSTLRISRLLFWIQETVERHLKFFGIGYEALRKANLVFLTARTWLCIARMPRLGEIVTVYTRPCGTQKAQFLRTYEVMVGKELCAQAVQTSVAADPVSHKILHPREFDRFGFDPACGGEAPMVPPRLKILECPLLGERLVYYSDLDYNGHLSNAVYGDFLTDFVPGGMDGRQIAELQINYINESLLGDVIAMHGVLDEADVFTLYGENMRGRAFDAYVKFR